MAGTEIDIPLCNTVADEILVINHWDDDTLFRSYLSRLPEPRATIDRLHLLALARCVRARIRDLESVRQQVEPRKSVEIDRALAKEHFRRKVTAWQMFPILALPSELLVEIFRYVVLSTQVMEGEVNLKLHLTWVCRAFREAAITDNVLWGRVMFTDPSPWTRSFEFLRRAGETPLDIAINDLSIPGVAHISPRQLHWLLDRILPKIDMIRTIVFSLHDWICPMLAIQRFAEVGHALLLEQLQVDRCFEPYLWSPLGFREAELRRPIPLFKGNTPSLRSLSLNGISIDWRSLRLEKLISLDIRRIARDATPTGTQFRAMLQAPHLTRLDLHAAAPHFLHAEQNLEPVYMRNLRELRLGDLEPDAIKDVLSIIVAPELRVLALITLVGANYTNAFRPLVGRFPRVQLLMVNYVHFAETQQCQRVLVRALDSMPELQLIKFESPDTGIATFLRWLLLDPRPFRDRGSNPMYYVDPTLPQNVIAPKLTTLVTVKTSPEDIAEFVRGRERMGVPLSLVVPPKEEWYSWPEAKSLQVREAVRPGCLKLARPKQITTTEITIRAEVDASVDYVRPPGATY